MLVEVTQDDIDTGTRNDCQWCPVALALKRATCHEFGVFGTYCRDRMTGKRYDFLWSCAVRVFDYDSGFGMEPFTFELNITDEY